MRRRRGLLVLLCAVLAVTLGTFLVACAAKGPEADLHLRRVIITYRWDDPPSFRAIDPQGNEYDFFVTPETIIKSGQAADFAWADLILGDDLEIWANKIPVTPEPEFPHYQVVRIDIAPTTR